MVYDRYTKAFYWLQCKQFWVYNGIQLFIMDIDIQLYNRYNYIIDIIIQ